MNQPENGRWVTVKGPKELKPGDCVRYTDAKDPCDSDWCGNRPGLPDRLYVSTDGYRIAGEDDDDRYSWSPAALLESWRTVQIWHPEPVKPEGTWVTVKDPKELKPGDCVRYTDAQDPHDDDDDWYGNRPGLPDRRYVSPDGCRIVDEDGDDRYSWSPAALLESWRAVQVWRPSAPVTAFRFAPDKAVARDPGSPTNGRRAACAETAVREFLCATGEPQITDGTAIADLMADLLHLCDRLGLDGKTLAADAVTNWKRER